jgi:hypothetical protein
MNHINSEMKSEFVGEESAEMKLTSFGDPVTLAGSVPRTLSGAEAGRVIGWGCARCHIT